MSWWPWPLIGAVWVIFIIGVTRWFRAASQARDRIEQTWHDQ